MYFWFVFSTRETQSRGLTLIKPDRKPANLGEAGGTHGEDFSPPVWEGSEPLPTSATRGPGRPVRVWDRAAVSRSEAGEPPTG